MFVGKATVAVALVGALLAPAVASAQYGDTGDSERPTIFVFGQAGVGQAIRDLNVEGTAMMKSGMALGGGAGMQINPNLAFRATLDFSPADIEGVAGADLVGESINRTFYGVDMQVRHVTERGVMPFFALGLGGITISGDDDYESHSMFAAKGGFGLEYMPADSKLTYFGQGSAYLYEYSKATYQRWQTDMLWTVGLKYRLSR